MRKPKRITLILCTMMFFQVNAQQDTLKSTRDSIELVKKTLREHGEVQSAAVGFHGKASMQYHGFLYLLERLSHEELYRLTFDSSACIRVYAYAALLYCRSSKAKEAKARLGKDTAGLKSFVGCGYGNTTVAKSVINISRVYQRKGVDYFLKKDRYQLEAWRKKLFAGW